MDTHLSIKDRFENSYEITAFSEVIKPLVDQGALHIEHAEYAAACDTSAALSKAIDTVDVPMALTGDGATRPYSILLVGYKPLEQQQPLVTELLALDQSRFELLFVENSLDDVFAIPEERAGGNVTVLRLGDNYGVGVARNLGIRVATGKAIIMIDDDGYTTSENIEALITLFEEAAATVVRGKVVPRSASDTPPPHYAPGERVVQRYCDIEGMAIWRSSELKRVGMFDPLLFGHEGTDLTARLYPLNGPDAFLYEPKAVLWHDFSQDPQKVEAKLARYEKLTAYINHKNPDYRKILSVFRNLHNDLLASSMLDYRKRFVANSKVAPNAEPISIITTCYNGAEFIPAFIEALCAQTDQNFELIFVDDGSSDGSYKLLQETLPNGFPCKHIQIRNSGRAAALNRAFDMAQHNLCVVADVDDLPVPQRIEWARHAFAQHPDADMIGFMIYDVQSHARASRPFPRKETTLEVRSYFGMPAPFPGFAFRKANMGHRFDESLAAGIDCDWIFRAIIDHGRAGVIVPLNVTFYRLHEGQITSTKRNTQRATALRYLQQRHHNLLRNKLPNQEVLLEKLAGWQPIENGPDYWLVHEYAQSLLEGVNQAKVDGDSLREEVHELLNRYHLNILRLDRQKLKNHHSSSVRRSEQAQAAIEQAQAEIEHARRAQSEAETKVEALETSTSWRVTAPIRFLKLKLTK